MRIPRREFLIASGIAVGATSALASDSKTVPFTTSDDGKRLTVVEQGKPVFAYNYAPVEPPQGIAEKFRRANYLHPVYAPDGAAVTEDFPADHFHHRGVFWAWPNCIVNERKLNVWELDGARTVFKKWSGIDTSHKQFRIQAKSVWQFDDDGFAPIEEHVWLIVRPVRDGQRTIDFDLTFKNVADADVVFQGSSASAGTAGTGSKGYGGFCFRPNAAVKPFTFTAKDGVIAEDKMSCDTPWADIAWGTTLKQGVAIVQHPDNPGYPHPGWIMRHYGFLGASWPHTASHTLKPGEQFALRYRLMIHEGDCTSAGVAEAASAFANGQ